MIATGYAVVDEGGNIDVRTVSPTRIAALVNWLYTEQHLMVTRNMPDDLIEHTWSARRGRREVHHVTITAQEISLRDGSQVAKPA